MEIADVDGDDVNDIIYYQQNVRFVGESFIRPANLTVLKGKCDKRVNEWEEMFDTITVINPYLADFDVGDINDDGYVDVAFSSTDSTFANQFIQIYKGLTTASFQPTRTHFGPSYQWLLSVSQAR